MTTNNSYFNRLPTRVLKSFETSLVKQAGWKFNSLSVKITDLTNLPNGKVKVTGSFTVESESKLNITRPAVYSGRKVTWSNEVTGQGRVLCNKERLVASTATFTFIV